MKSGVGGQTTSSSSNQNNMQSVVLVGQSALNNGNGGYGVYQGINTPG